MKFTATVYGETVITIQAGKMVVEIKTECEGDTLRQGQSLGFTEYLIGHER